MIPILLGAAATVIVAGAWPFRRSAGPTDTSASDNQAVDQRDWIYGDASAHREPGDGPVRERTDESARDVESTKDQLPEETIRRAELDARTIVERAERQAREIVAAAAEPSADGREAAARTADEIVREAQERATRILAEASAAGALVDAEAERVGSLLIEERAKLAAFLKELLEEVEGSATVDPHVLDLDEARERKQGTGTTD